MAALGASALGATLAHGQTWRCRDVPSAGSLPAVSGIEAMQRGRPCAVGHPSPAALLSVDPYPDLIDPLGVQHLLFLRSCFHFRPNRMFSCSPCVLLLQTAVSSSGISV